MTNLKPIIKDLDNQTIDSKSAIYKAYKSGVDDLAKVLMKRMYLLTSERTDHCNNTRYGGITALQNMVEELKNKLDKGDV